MYRVSGAGRRLHFRHGVADRKRAEYRNDQLGFRQRQNPDRSALGQLAKALCAAPTGSLAPRYPPPRWHALSRARGGAHQVADGHGVTGGTVTVAGGASTDPKSAGLTISRYSMSGE